MNAVAGAAVVIEEFRPVVRNTLRGFCRVRLRSGMIVHDVSVHTKNDRTWVSPPSKPMVSAAGELMRDDAGKLRYNQMIEFASKEIRNKFSDAVIAALKAAHPEALDEGAS